MKRRKNELSEQELAASSEALSAENEALKAEGEAQRRLIERLSARLDALEAQEH